MKNCNNEDSYKDIINHMRLARSNLSLSSMYSLMFAYGNIESALLAASEKATRMGDRVKIPDFSRIESEYEKIVKIGGEVIHLYSKKYPDILRSIKFPPFVITVLGDSSLLFRENIAIIGSRRASFAGKKFAQIVSTCLSEEGYVICSGLASGIDAASHGAALNNNMPTIAVLGCGIDVIYPKENKDLYYKIIDHGLLISEFSLGTKPFSVNFPIRNRIIAGMSTATIVVEAAKNSGSLITARYALDFGREVFAVPGSPFDGRYDGTNQLIKDGAILADSCDTIIEALQFSVHRTSNNLFDSGESSYLTFYDKRSEVLNNNAKDLEIESVKKTIIDRLSYTPISIDQIIEELNINSEVVLIAISELDIEKKIECNFFNEISLLVDTLA